MKLESTDMLRRALLNVAASKKPQGRIHRTNVAREEVKQKVIGQMAGVAKPVGKAIKESIEESKPSETKHGFRDPKYIDRDTHTALCLISNCRDSEWNTLIDVGASDGRWARDMRKEGSRVIFFEPNRWQWEEDMMNKGFARYGDQVVWKAAWNEDGRTMGLHLPQSSKWLGEVHLELDKPGIKQVSTARVDTEVLKHEMPGPYWLKIDGHGSDWYILDGCTKIWDQIVGINLEANLYQITETTWILQDLLPYLEEKGFRLYYMGNTVYMGNMALWEVECIFLREKHCFFDIPMRRHLGSPL